MHYIAMNSEMCIKSQCNCMASLVVTSTWIDDKKNEYCKTLNFREHLIFAQIREGVVKGGQGQYGKL